MPVSKIRNRQCQFCKVDYVLGVDSKLHKYCSVSCRVKYGNATAGKKYRESVKGKLNSRAWRLKNDFNISLDDFNDLLQKQNNACAICKTQEPTGYNWHVDHCHSSNKVRGILCSKCNQGLGLFKDSITNLTEAIKYLHENQ